MRYARQCIHWNGFRIEMLKSMSWHFYIEIYYGISRMFYSVLAVLIVGPLRDLTACKSQAFKIAGQNIMAAPAVSNALGYRIAHTKSILVASVRDIAMMRCCAAPLKYRLIRELNRSLSTVVTSFTVIYMEYASEAISLAACFGSGWINRILSAPSFFSWEIHNNWYRENSKLVSNVLVDAGQLYQGSRVESISFTDFQEKKCEVSQ